MINLREYQERAVNSVIDYYENGGTGNPLVSVATGGGKSIIQAALIKRVCERYGAQKFLCITHVKELLQQNMAELSGYWPEVKTSLYCAGLKSRTHNGQVKFASVQSAWKKWKLFSDVNAVIIDECHLVPSKGHGMYRAMLQSMKEFNPKLSVIGLSATPYRLKTGWLHEGPERIFTDLIHETGILDLVDLGFLSPLKSITSKHSVDSKGIKKANGEFVSADAARAMTQNISVSIDDMMKRAEGRKKILIFCCTIEHAERTQRMISERGLGACSIVHGKLQAHVRSQEIERFRSGRSRFMVNVNVLTTGFNVKPIDCIVFMRPTTSVGLYIQMAGRGTRTAPGKTDCLVLDYTDNIRRLGPVTFPRVKASSQEEARDKDGNLVGYFVRCKNKDCGMWSLIRKEAVSEDPVKWLVAAPKCQACWANLPLPDIKRQSSLSDEETKKRRIIKLSTDADTVDIMARQKPGAEPAQWFSVRDVTYRLHQKKGKPEGMCVTYHCGLYLKINEFVLPEHGGYPAIKALRWVNTMYEKEANPPFSAKQLLMVSDLYKKPARIMARKGVKGFWEILEYDFTRMSEQEKISQSESKQL